MPTPLQEVALDLSVLAVQVDLANTHGTDVYGIAHIAKQAETITARLWKIRDTAELDPRTERTMRNARRVTQ